MQPSELRAACSAGPQGGNERSAQERFARQSPGVSSMTGRGDDGNIVNNNLLSDTITAYPKWTPTQLPTPASQNNYYLSLQYGANDCSDDETVIMANKRGENLKDEESTVETAFLVWGSDDESELDKGVGGLDPAHHDSDHVNGR